MKKQLLIVCTILINAFVFGQPAKQEALLPLTVDSFAAKINRQVKPQIIDARKPEEFAINHINGAVNVDQFAGNYAGQLTQFDKQQPVFIYAIQNYRPGILAKELRELGYKEVYELKAGIANWIGGGNPYYSSVKNNISLADYRKNITTNKLVLVDIGTKYCGTCVKVKQLVDSLKQGNDLSYKIEEIDLYYNPELVAGLKEIEAVPTVLLYKDGKVIWKRTGLSFTKNELETAIAKAKQP
jgi:rhodanese-related sulfurtransferase/glutaredoxin-related protein